MLLAQWIRVFRRAANGLLTDISLPLQNEGQSVALDLASDEYVYVAQYYPFNNLYFDLGTPNEQVSAWSAETWDGASWEPVVDVIDATDLAGATLGRSGAIQYSPDREFGWHMVADTNDERAEFQFAGKKVYSLYWLRFRVVAALSAGTTLNAIDYKFATDAQLEDLDPEIDRFLPSWSTGKTNWARQLRIASQHVIQDLKVRGLIVHPGQILRMDDVSWATAYKALELIYTRLGEGYEFQIADAKKNYHQFINQKRFTFDRDSDGQVDRGEVARTAAKGVR